MHFILRNCEEKIVKWSIKTFSTLISLDFISAFVRLEVLNRTLAKKKTSMEAMGKIQAKSIHDPIVEVNEYNDTINSIWCRRLFSQNNRTKTWKVE